MWAMTSPAAKSGTVTGGAVEAGGRRWRAVVGGAGAEPVVAGVVGSVGRRTW